MRFNEQDHIYYNDDGEVYLGSTSLIKKFCKPFDKQKIAAKYAKKHKRTVKDVLEEWDKKSKDAINKGLAFHKMQEDHLNEKLNISIEDESHPIVKAQWLNGIKINDTLKLKPGVYPELIVWSDKYAVAGQADYVEITNKGSININDYKTSAEIKKEGYRKWDGSVDTMQFPLHNLDDCNFNHYSLQLNLYAFLIKQHNRNLKIGRLTIEHIIGDFNEDTKTFSNVRSIIHKVPDMQEEVRILLEYYKNSKN